MSDLGKLLGVPPAPETAFSRLAAQYERQFGAMPPIGEYDPWPEPEDMLAMLRTAIDRGTPITEADYPQVDVNRVY